MAVRVFSSFVAAQLILFAASAAMGVFGSQADASRHVLLAVLALLLSCLTQVGLFTYFTVTGKMVTQAVHLGKLEHGPLNTVKALKRSVTRLLAVVVLAVLAVVISGAMHLRSDGAGGEHVLLTALAVAAHCVVYYCQLGLIVQNAAVVAATLAAYERQRKVTSPEFSSPRRSSSTDPCSSS